MIFLDKMIPKIITPSKPFSCASNEIIKCIIPVENSAIIKAISKVGDNHTKDGSTSATGISRLPGETVYGEFLSVSATTGLAIAYYTSIVERL